MKFIDIRAKHISDEEALKDSHARFHLDIKEVTREEVRKLPPYEIEIGKKDKGGLIKGIRQVSFAFNTHFGFLKRYRVKASFILSCFLLLALVQSLIAAGNILTLKQKGGEALASASPQRLFSASLALKETNKNLATLGEIPELFSDKAKLLGKGSAWAEFFLRAAGYYNPRYYLILFQNNSEIRATGGFIGSYALLKIDRGVIEIKKIEGTFNVSGQQSVPVVPPEPIQKISASWSFHDANWFFDFPTSAKAISWFYEKSGGPTVDGIVAITPEFTKRLLDMLGPITLPSYELSLDAKNFINTLQYEVEINYKERGIEDPKKILAEAVPLLIEKISFVPKKTLILSFMEGLKEKEIFFYFSRPEEEALVSYYNWGGAIMETNGDYLAVVNSNINGFKTDHVISQEVTHQSDILSDGRIKDTVTIKRTHAGGDEAYEWYNKVNADFLRVYVPKGSLLLDANGHTIEFNDPPLNYRALKFREYPDVVKASDSQIVDGKNKTRIFEESGKTVFGNWVYVSPGEEVEVTYTYLLPFTINLQEKQSSLSLMVQKQAGITYPFSHTFKSPKGSRVGWEMKTPSIINKDRVYASIFSF